MFLSRACHRVSSALIMKCTPGTALMHGQFRFAEDRPRAARHIHNRSSASILHQQLHTTFAMRSYNSFCLKPNTTRACYHCSIFGSYPSGTRSSTNPHEASAPRASLSQTKIAFRKKLDLPDPASKFKARGYQREGGLLSDFRP
jgi:hypothetical protein